MLAASSRLCPVHRVRRPWSKELTPTLPVHSASSSDPQFFPQTASGPLRSPAWSSLQAGASTPGARGSCLQSMCAGCVSPRLCEDSGAVGRDLSGGEGQWLRVSTVPPAVLPRDIYFGEQTCAWHFWLLPSPRLLCRNEPRLVGLPQPRYASNGRIV